MREYLPVIKTCSLFHGVDDSDITAILSCLCAAQRAYCKGEYILRAGGHTDQISLLLSGGAHIIQEDFWGNRNLVSGIQPGQLFAEAFACTPGAVLTVSVTAEAACNVLFLDVRRVLAPCSHVCTFHGQVMRNLFSELAVKNLRLNDKLTHMAQRSTRAKLLSYLSAEATRHASSSFDIPYNRQELADFLSVERSAMSAELSRLKCEGVLSYHKNHFELAAFHGDQ